jgi:mono/diheme cytochrome c family protein
MKRIALLSLFLSMGLLQAQDLPEGKGKKEVENICGSCHGTDVIAAMRGTKDEWAGVVDAMVQRGATGTKEELDTIIEYLAKNFPPEQGKPDASKPPAK